jgi:hypothetical protein
MKLPAVLKNMTMLDWLLAVVFIGLVTFLVQSFFPPFGWLIGLAVALGLLYLAKRRRDKLMEQ